MSGQVFWRDGCPIHYWLSGPKTGSLVVFTHGATMDHRMFDAQVPAVSEHYRMLTWDVRGHGQSQPIGDDFSVRGAAEDLLALLDHLGYERAALVGQSLGGYIAQEVVYYHPQRATALVIIGSTPVTMTFSTTDMLALRLSPTMFRLWPDGHLRRLIARSTAVTPAAQAYAYEATRQVSKKDFVTIWKAVANSLHADPDYRITHPLLLTHGDRDNTGRIRKAAPLWAARDPNCRYVVIPSASHNANQDNPEFFNGVLLEFLHEHVLAVTPSGDEPRALFE